MFPAPGQADFLQQRHLRHWAENFQKVLYEKIKKKNFRKTSKLSMNVFCKAPNARFSAARSRWARRAVRAPRLLLKIVGARLATAPARLPARFENQGGLYHVITKSYLWVGWFWKL